MTPTIRGAAAAKILSKDSPVRSASYFSLTMIAEGLYAIVHLRGYYPKT